MVQIGGAMTILRVPTSTELSSYVQRTSFDGRDFVLFFQFNQRLGRWFVDIADQDESPIVSGVRLVTNSPFIRSVTDPRRPVGELLVADLQGGGSDPATLATFARDAGLEELGARFVLTYADAAELGREV